MPAAVASRGDQRLVGDQRQGQYIDSRRPRPLERAGAGLHRRTRGDYIVDEQHVAALERGLPVPSHAKGSRQVAPALVVRQAYLRLCEA